MPNHLSSQTSPYLLQHAHNPVDWYPWSPEAFAEARRRDCPIFLSVGYSTCYWCHVMERECFENASIAADLNAACVCIKVDREERPDVDQLYMTAVQLMTRSGGWPMSVFLTPEGKPFYGATYIPPSDWHGRPGLPSLLRAISQAWDERRGEVNQSADRLTEMLGRLSVPAGPEISLTLDAAFIDNLIGRSISDYDAKFGGFGAAPKFPRETLLQLLLAYCAEPPADTSSKSEIRKMLTHTLDAMARGGIRDQLGGAFHRYSTDQQWLVPHFEIMLYDNAMLLEIYAQASIQLGRPDFADVARGIADFILSDMTGADGQFFTALDAEADGHEGQSYLWTATQVEQILGPDRAGIFNKAYGLSAGPNFADPHHGTGTPDSNVLMLAVSLDEARNPDLAGMRSELLASRKQRKQPLLDTKVLTNWNALMIHALAVAGQILSEPRYLKAAQRAADFLLKHLIAADGALLRSYRDGVSHTNGFLDDYASLALALHQLHKSIADSRYAAARDKLVQQMHSRFASPAGVFYFTDSASGDTIVRQAAASDSPLPSGNALAAHLFLALELPQHAAPIIRAFAEAMDNSGEAYSALVEATMHYIAAHGALQVAASAQPAASSPELVTARAERISPTRVRVHLTIADGYHINASEASNLTPTRLTSSVPGDVIYPPPNTTLPDGTPAYSGLCTIELTTVTAVPGPLALTLQFQPCSSSACLPPRRIVLEM
jgi:uncharacterized protein YyaL (SSP411 family)